MSTNYYARIIPPKVKREMLKQLIDVGDFKAILEEVHNLYDSFKVQNNGTTNGGQIHLGKRSCGWKFLWNPNIYIIHHGHSEQEDDGQGRVVTRWVHDPNTAHQIYPLTKKGIKTFIDREDVVIVDEYNNKQDKEKFWEMALTWGAEDGWDDAAYDKFERQNDREYNPWTITGELIDYLSEQGYKFTNFTNSDFYSDGLRFAGFIDFC